MAHEGIGVLVISTEMPEVLGICDRILTMFEGRVTGEFRRGEATEEKLLAAAAGIVSARIELTREKNPHGLAES